MNGDHLSEEVRMRRLFQTQHRTGGFSVGPEGRDFVAVGAVEKSYTATARSAGSPAAAPFMEEIGQGPIRGNQDTAFVFESPSGVLMAVFDGLGGYDHGREASVLARQTLSDAAHEWAAAGCEEPDIFLVDALRQMKMRLDAQFESKKSDTTASLVFVGSPGKLGVRPAWAAGAGDSLTFRVGKANHIEQLTSDDSLGCIWVHGTEVRRSGGNGSSLERTVRSSTGSTSKPRSFDRWGHDGTYDLQSGVSRPFKVHNGDVVILATDGITGDSAAQDPVDGIAGALLSVFQPDADRPDSALRELFDRARKFDDRTAIAYFAGGSQRWPDLQLPPLTSLVDEPLEEWEAAQRRPMRLKQEKSPPSNSEAVPRQASDMFIV